METGWPWALSSPLTSQLCVFFSLSYFKSFMEPPHTALTSRLDSVMGMTDPLREASFPLEQVTAPVSLAGLEGSSHPEKTFRILQPLPLCGAILIPLKLWKGLPLIGYI